MTFNELNLNKRIVDAITKAGYKEPSPIQEQAIPLMMDGKDLIACAQTGTGKTAAFALPVLNMLENESRENPRAIILTPTRELAIQILDNFKKYSRYMRLRTVCFYGGAKQGPQLSAYGRGCDILVATPGRLIDYMNQGVVSLKDIEILILDEADRMLDMGFIHDIRRVVSEVPEDRQTVMFSATMPKEIEALARDILTDPETIKIAPTTSPAETVDQKICFMEKESKKTVLGDFLKQEDVKKSIVFTRTKHGADHLVRDLGKLGIISMAIHGNKTQGQRQNALERFRSGNIKVLIATDVASRGIDIPKISHVFNYDLPEETESYIHRIGRVGRAGQTGEAITLCSRDEMGLLYDIEKMMQKEIPELETELSIPIERVQKGARRRFGKANAEGDETGMKRGGRHGERRTRGHRGGHDERMAQAREERKQRLERRRVRLEGLSVEEAVAEIKATTTGKKASKDKDTRKKDFKKENKSFTKTVKTGFEKFYKKNEDILADAEKSFEKKLSKRAGVKEDGGKKSFGKKERKPGANDRIFKKRDRRAS
ncbi:DEAD/DEAH box helicase [Oribacterium sp. WCC10]|uniref:DEAD/DEAH box helicase n=1 Tax=Oribacterium sp. WCC10 TaxID=1855343 RepID=UPI0008E75506|nr:DEAD/DEAH box helicase [Oribacterium sp. WCC10]SFG63785.1 ATP-dependent RNA helicase RhlE [Oribacterium sp. WCC10]